MRERNHAIHGELEMFSKGNRFAGKASLAFVDNFSLCKASPKSKTAKVTIFFGKRINYIGDLFINE